MLGEELEEALVARKGFAEDRAYAVTDAESGRVLSAKRAGWEGLFGFYAALEHGPDGEGARLRVTLPDGKVVSGDDEWRDEVRLRVTDPVARRVMTTLPQADLPKDQGIIGTTSRYNENNVGVYAQVLRGGRVRRGDRFTLV
jgi:uncharacterized protein YcbX